MSSTPERAIEDDPLLGRYLVHFTTHRLRLLIQAGVIYALSALVINLATFNLQGTLVNVVVPMLYALVATPLIWAVAHLWNREVIIFERGFTYRQGSVVAAFAYESIVRVDVRVQQIHFFGVLPYERVTATLESEPGDMIRIGWVFRDVRRLADILERAVLKARLPIAEGQIARGADVAFGALTLTRDGLRDEGGRLLSWEDFSAVRVERDAVVISSGSEVWGRFGEDTLHSEALLVSLLRGRVRP